VNKRPELDLLLELAKLLRKYGPEAFESLSVSLKSPEITNMLSELLGGLAHEVRKTRDSTKESKGKVGRSAPDKSLTSLKSTDPPKYSLIIDIQTDLLEKRKLPTIGDLHEFAFSLGISNIQSTSRQKVISAIINTLMRMSIEEISSKTQMIVTHPSREGNIEGWSDFVLKKDKRLID
jgi:hypothetical protein